MYLHRCLCVTGASVSTRRRATGRNTSSAASAKARASTASSAKAQGWRLSASRRRKMVTPVEELQFPFDSVRWKILKNGGYEQV